MHRCLPHVLAALAAVLLAAAPAARAHDAARVDAHAPIGVMGDHVHDAGEFMLSYRYSRTSMRGNRDGTRRVSGSEVLERFPVAPTSMDMEMHMFGAMWAPLDSLTLMAMVPYLRMDMDHRTRSGRRFTTRSDGLGDLRLTGLVRVFEAEHHQVHLNAGISFPTGSISEKDETPMGRVRLPYPMQLGSGTFDALPGVTVLGQSEHWSWGGQALGTVRLHRNRKGYRRGHAYELTAWLARRWTPWLSTAVRLDWNQWGDFSGEDDDLNPLLVPTADPELRGGERLDALLSLNLQGREGWLRGHRLAFEVGRPLHQSLDGPQLEVDWRATAGWQYSW